MGDDSVGTSPRSSLKRRSLKPEPEGHLTGRNGDVARRTIRTTLIESSFERMGLYKSYAIRRPGIRRGVVSGITSSCKRDARVVRTRLPWLLVDPKITLDRRNINARDNLHTLDSIAMASKPVRELQMLG